MSEQVKVNDGDWFVEHDWRYNVRQAIRVTAQIVFYMGEGFSLNDGSHPKERRVRLDKVVFASPSKEAAKSVAKRLASSDALFDEESRQAVIRRNQRTEKIVAQQKDAALA